MAKRSVCRFGEPFQRPTSSEIEAVHRPRAGAVFTRVHVKHVSQIGRVKKLQTIILKKQNRQHRVGRRYCGNQQIQRSMQAFPDVSGFG